MVYAVIKEGIISKEHSSFGYANEKVLEVLGSYLDNSRVDGKIYSCKIINENKEFGRYRRRYEDYEIERFIETKDEALLLLGALKI